MKFRADFHIHSKYSRATAKNLDLEHMYIAAQHKGVTVLGTGDFTHPQWFEELNTKLIPAEAGLFKLDPDLARLCDRQVLESCRGEVRFVLTAEISNIYKKGDRTRKNHNLILVPDMAVAAKFNARLDAIGNIKSDGRPILGLDARSLLEILLETSDEAFFIPAHIWTPWFSMLGSKSGFDSVSECFEDLTPHIHAAETGLSSDPAMNWRVSALDGLTLVSNSDAHSPAKIGREANLFDTDLSYNAMVAAMQSGDPEHFVGTIEFYPEEGKYHLDGHRKCDVSLWPTKTIAMKGICPVCGKGLTLGVLHRVEALADRPEGCKPENAVPFYNLIPLADMLAELLSVGPNTKTVQRRYDELLQKLGPELDILQLVSPEAIERVGISLLGEAIKRMRQGEISLIPGYDGEFGKIKIFNSRERQQLLGQLTLFDMAPGEEESVPEPRVAEIETSWRLTISPEKKPDMINATDKCADGGLTADTSIADGPTKGKVFLNSEQERAIRQESGPLMVVAGPGTGKTFTLTRRIAHLIQTGRVAPEQILAVTFTHKAAGEMTDRLQKLLQGATTLPTSATFHSLCYRLFSELQQTELQQTEFEQKEAGNQWGIVDEVQRLELVTLARQAAIAAGVPVKTKPKRILDRIIAAKQLLKGPEGELGAAIEPVDKADELPSGAIDELRAVYGRYQELLGRQQLLDFEDLLFFVVQRLENDPTFRHDCRQRFRYIFVDEYQDLNQAQYRMIRALAPPEYPLCVIGDPDQSIYGFRGSDPAYFNRFTTDYPSARIVHLTRNYRSTEAILETAHNIISRSDESRVPGPLKSGIDGLKTIALMPCASDKAEAVAVGKTIESLVGGTGFHSVDFDKLHDVDDTGAKAFSDIAILYRSHRQSDVLASTLSNAGIPFQVANREKFLERPGITEIMAALKVIHGVGSWSDVAKIRREIGNGISKETFHLMQAWWIKNGFTLQQAFKNVSRFPIPGMSRIRQQGLLCFVERSDGLTAQLKHLPVSEQVNGLAQELNTPLSLQADATGVEDITRLHDLAEPHETDTTAFLARVALNSDTDIYDARAQKVALMTIHAAKGLEFPVVFIVGCEDDFLPYRKPGTSGSATKALPTVDVEEERRLFYVAVTRAKQRLYLSYAHKRTIYGRAKERRLSPFVADIERRLIREETRDSPNRPRKQVQLQLF